MAAKLVITRQRRENTDVAWHKASDEAKASVKASGIRSVTARRLFNNGLKKYTVTFFPRVELYDAWAANETIQGMVADRKAYNEANGIADHQVVIDMPNFKL
jgi:phosphoserine aminotransferase